MLVAQSYPTLCDSMNSSPPGSSVLGILQARILEWVASLFSKDLPDPGIETGSPALQADSLPSEDQGSPFFKFISKYINSFWCYYSYSCDLNFISG